MARPAIQTGPHLYLMEKQLLWDFEFAAVHGGAEHRVEVSMPVDGLWTDNDHSGAKAKSLLNRSLVQKIEFCCDCNQVQYYGYMLCPHVAAALEFLRKRLERATTEEALQWLEGCVARPEALGRALVKSLEDSKALSQTASSSLVRDEDFRIMWRITESKRYGSEDMPFGLALIIQKPKGRGGWTVGKRVRDPLEDLPASALSNTHDRMLAIICDSYFSSYKTPPSNAAYMQILDVLRECPHVTWDAPNFPPATIRQGEVCVQLVEKGGSFMPRLLIDGELLDTEELLDLGKERAGGILVNGSKHSIVYFTLTPEQTKVLDVLEFGESRGALFDRESAEHFARLVSDPKSERRISLQLPKSLAGPDVVLPPVVELHLAPIDRGVMEARLRVACTVLDEPPVPGIGVARTLVHTPAGAYHIVRDLAAEATNAEMVANSLGMGEYAFDGPYTWQLQSIDQSLKLIERIRSLGKSAPIVCWPKCKPLRLIGDITPQALKVRLTSDRDWFGIEGELEMDGLHVPLAELMVAIRNGSRFVPLGDNQYATISNELRSRLSVIDDVTSSEGGRLRLPRAATPLIDEAIGADIPVERDLRWQETIDRLNQWQANPPEPPKALNANLRDYQVSGYQWLSKLSQWGLGGCLADDMGLGKTVQTLGVLLERAEKGAALIVAPTSVGVNWLRETERFAPGLKARLYREHDRDHLIQSAGAGDLIITSYQMLQRDVERVASRSWATLVLDEAQYIKNFQTKTNQAVRQIDMDWCVALSGTPLENHLGELWSLMRVVSPGLLGSWERFRKRFGEPIERDHDHDRLKALGHVVRPFILRRTKQEVLKELPPRTEVVLSAELSTAERKRYDAARIAAIAELTTKKSDEPEQQKRIRVLAWLTRLRQLSCHPGLVDPRWTKSSAKLDLFMETVNELRQNNHRALVFSQFVQHLGLVRNALDSAGITYQYLDGTTPTSKRQQAIDAFQRGEGDLFLISLKAGGTGLNLTAADYVLHLDPWWNPAVEDQATDRAHRIGQTRAVTVYRLVAKDTIEEQILSMHASKRELLAGVLDGADRAAKMTTEELVELIRDTNQLNAIS